MIEKNIICVICPSSCKVCVKGDGKNIESITGYNCERGREYAQQEYTDPQRTLTTTMKAEGYTCPIIAVRSDRPIPKGMQLEIVEEVRKTVARPPFQVGKVMIENVLGTGANIVLANQ